MTSLIPGNLDALGCRLVEQRQGVSQDLFDMAMQRFDTAGLFMDQEQWANSVHESGHIVRLLSLGRMIHEGSSVTPHCLVEGMPPATSTFSTMRTLHSTLPDKAIRIEDAFIGTLRPSSYYTEQDAQHAFQFAARMSKLLAGDLDARYDATQRPDVIRRLNGQHGMTSSLAS